MNKKTRIDRLISIYLPAFNEQQIEEDDSDLVLTHEQAKKSGHFMTWLEYGGIFEGDRRDELYELMMVGTTVNH